MNVQKFEAFRNQAIELFNSQPARDRHTLSLDAIFTALVLAEGKGAGTRAQNRRTSEETAPAWFEDTLKKLRGSGEAMTVGRFLMLAGKFPATRSDALNASRWLREAGYTPRKTGGNLLFDL